MVLVLSALTGAAFGTGVIVGLRSEALRSPVSTPVERPVESVRKSLQAAGQRREKDAQESLAGRRAHRRHQWAANSVGRAMLTMVRCVLSLPHDLCARILERRKCSRWLL
jgi:hypothetical protein